MGEECSARAPCRRVPFDFYAKDGVPMQPVQRNCDFVEVDTPDLAGDPRFFPEVHLKKQLPPPPPRWLGGWVGGWVGGLAGKVFGFDYYYYDR